MCGIYLFFSNYDKKLSELHNNLRLIQHRGQDSYGIFYKNKGNIILTDNKGKVDHYNGDESTNLFMGHLRYTTSGALGEDGTQPIYTDYKFGEFFFIYNGNIPCNEYSFLYNREFSLDTTLIKYFLEFESSKTNNWIELLEKFINTFTRGYSIIIYTKTDIYLLKDRYGVRPLCYSISDDKTIFEAVSESVGVTADTNITEVNAGSILQLKLDYLDEPAERYNFLTQNKMLKDYGGKCIFEYIYFLSPDTIWDNVLSKKIRQDWATKLAKSDLKKNNFNQPSSEYLVIGIPSTGIQPGKTYAEFINYKYSQAITKNNNISRTFILSKTDRDAASKKKYIYDKSQISGKRVIIIDDSIVRGITMKNIVVRLRECEAKEVHIRIISPEIKDICKYGIDIPTREELVAFNMDNSQMNEYFD